MDTTSCLNNITIKPMTEVAARIISTWTYEPPYDFYDMAGNDEALVELLNGEYFQMLDESQNIVGYCCHGNSARLPIGVELGFYPEDGSVDVGVGMRPDLTGHGNGRAFFRAILAFLSAEHHTESFCLTVATFNTRAIRLYELFGFKPLGKFLSNDVEFQVMEKKA